ncbi:MAG: SIS domain-containing protein [Henriciella sp.]
MTDIAELINSPEALAQCGATWTVREIYQQPEMILATQEVVEQHRDALNAFLTPFVSDPQSRIILAGAGTSAYIGKTLAPMLMAELGRPVEAIATTDLLAAPRSYLNPDVPTLMISYGRSGNSPESSGAVAVANQFAPGCKHLLITCNPDGAMNAIGQASSNAHVLLLPEATHDRSFAMTSSFTSMMYATSAAFAPFMKTQDQMAKDISVSMRHMLDFDSKAIEIAKRDFNRFVYLGSHGFAGLAQEAALKMLELTDGCVISTFESSLGFRHGPKTIVTDRTMIVVFVSNNDYTRQYDLDLIHELLMDDRYGDLLVIAGRKCPDVPDDKVLYVPGAEQHSDLALIYPYIVPAQLIALHQSLEGEYSPDQPNRTGTVNRVVQGVRIHPLIR